MKKNILLLLLCVILPMPATAQLSLSAAAIRAIESNNGLKSAKSNIQAKSAGISSAKSKYFPTVNFDITYNYIDKAILLDLDPIRSAMMEIQSGNQVGFANLESILKTGQALGGEQQLQVKQAALLGLDEALPHFKQTLKERAFPKAQFSFNQAIFTGGKIDASVRAAESLKNVEYAKYYQAKSELVNTVVTYYLNALMAEENLAVRKEALETVGNHNKRAEGLLKEGLIAPHDKLRADVALSEANRNYYTAQELSKISKMALNSILDTNDVDNLADKLVYKPLKDSLDLFIINGSSSNHTINQIEAGYSALNEKANAESANYFPTIYGFGMYDVFDHYRSGIDPKWAVGIGANFTIFNGMKRKNDYEMAKIEAESMQLMKNDASEKIELAIRNFYMMAKLAESQYFSLKVAIEQAEENYRLNDKRYATGLGTSIESLDAQVSLQAVKLQSLQALKDYYMNLALLYSYSGQTDKFIEFWNN